ncbi:N-6 DNA methylase [Phycicoccus sp. BSK3Z-2]|uniref:N-6 DNA methylase n=1 Tax=Phycicoccus avicenniae TaxID=2828860 RepID=A0A941D7X0_9MICO|nr:N-6 DNA methylase [Phycicoccus avicenniae]MBR7743744.1 N-6 DNA methylase [Phycicoccus avicenniae]
MALSGPEHLKVRLPVIDALKTLGWEDGQLQWRPEWRVPQSPNEAAKREGGRSFSHWPVDLVVFKDPEMPADWQNVVGLFEFKKPTLNEGVSQLEIYLAREPRARFGVWTNGTKSATVYKLPDGTFKTVKRNDLRLPTASDDFERATSKALTFADLSTPSERELKMSFQALLDAVVARDSIVTRSENQLDQLCNMLLLKLESDITASYVKTKPVMFQLGKTENETGTKIREEFDQMVNQREEVFREEQSPQLLLDDHTIKEIVFAWSGWNLVGVGAEAVSSAFQVFRRANLKAGEGQYFTPARVVEAAVRVMDIQPTDKIIDPACGTGGFLIEAFRDINERIGNEAAVTKWANRQVFGVDKDSINVKLARAMMLVLGDGSTHIHIGDSLREDRWSSDYPYLSPALRDGAFTVVLTNPPFGRRLRLSARECELNHYSISWAAGKEQRYVDLELGLVFLERSYRLLAPGGRVGIILPETYFFSPTYAWLHEWMQSRFIVRGLVNVPMEAFQGFCRAKTNLYIFEKKTTRRRA